MSDRKPIFVITVPFGSDIPSISESAKVKEVSKDYHILIVAGKEMNFQIFSDKEIEPIQIEELKKMLCP